MQKKESGLENQVSSGRRVFEGNVVKNQPECLKAIVLTESYSIVIISVNSLCKYSYRLKLMDPWVGNMGPQYFLKNLV